MRILFLRCRAGMIISLDTLYVFTDLPVHWSTKTNKTLDRRECQVIKNLIRKQAKCFVVWNIWIQDHKIKVAKRNSMSVFSDQFWGPSLKYIKRTWFKAANSRLIPQENQITKECNRCLSVFYALKNASILLYLQKSNRQKNVIL